MFITFPATIIEQSLPLGGLLLFLLLYAGLVRNPKVPYFLRYNACQAILLDITLIIMSYLVRILPLVQIGSVVFVFSICIFIFTVFQCINGGEPEIPLISNSVRLQI